MQNFFFVFSFQCQDFLLYGLQMLHDISIYLFWILILDMLILFIFYISASLFFFWHLRSVSKLLEEETLNIMKMIVRSGSSSLPNHDLLQWINKHHISSFLRSSLSALILKNTKLMITWCLRMLHFFYPLVLWYKVCLFSLHNYFLRI